ncbi:hypothetical protein BDP27DRAFT_1371164 [Rhodocollybia butyracea]|uniref:Uncharacterized protein n=1 Tax=Rhodocollybia butyracea TaxID=206335 RepID=A0A9P5TZR8_9AGAR|nr:hypothetical protein BDP27DRAFT_1371164 [Rhodocollybia butyracea]
MTALVPLDNLLGAAFIGIILSTVIYGVTCLQVYQYFIHHSYRDTTLLKIFVALLWTIDSFHVALLATFYYEYTVTNFGDYIFLSKVNWPLMASDHSSTQVVLADTITIMVQMFFAYRVYLLSNKQIVIPVVIFFVGLGQLALAIVYVAKAEQVELISEIGKITVEFCPVIDSHCADRFGIGALAIDISGDAIVTIAMIYYLWKNKSSFKRQPSNEFRATVVKKSIQLIEKLDHIKYPAQWGLGAMRLPQEIGDTSALLLLYYLAFIPGHIYYSTGTLWGVYRVYKYYVGPSDSLAADYKNKEPELLADIKASKSKFEQHFHRNYKPSKPEPTPVPIEPQNADILSWKGSMGTISASPLAPLACQQIPWSGSTSSQTFTGSAVCVERIFSGGLGAETIQALMVVKAQLRIARIAIIKILG